MAQRRQAGFNIPLNFYDGPEVASISRRIRAAAIGVWAMAGNYAATQLSDGYVGAEQLKMFGCTDAIRVALMSTINKKGELSPLWVDARDGGVQLTNWAKHQRTNDEVTTYRETEAERKRLEREAKREALASRNGKTSIRTLDGQSADVRSDVRDPETETKTETEIFGYDSGQATDPNGSTGVAATIGAELVARANLPAGIPADTLAKLRVRANDLVKRGSSTHDVLQALVDYGTRTGVTPGILPDLVADVVKRRNAHAVGPPVVNGGQVHKMRATANLAAEVRAAENQTASAQLAPKELA
jgi:hypothetical protein